MKTTKSYTLKCKECGFRIRGPNHKDGDHHKMGRPSKPKVRRRR